jgi:hypothetical protein
MASRATNIIGILAGVLLLNFGYELIYSPYIERHFFDSLVGTQDYNILLGILLVSAGGLIIVFSIRRIIKR